MRQKVANGADSREMLDWSLSLNSVVQEQAKSGLQPPVYPDVVRDMNTLRNQAYATNPNVERTLLQQNFQNDQANANSPLHQFVGMVGSTVTLGIPDMISNLKTATYQGVDEELSWGAWQSFGMNATLLVVPPALKGVKWFSSMLAREGSTALSAEERAALERNLKLQGYNGSIDDVLSYYTDNVSDRLFSLATGHKTGVAVSEESVRVGTVQMELHPNYQSLRAEAESAGFNFKEVKDYPHVEVIQTVDAAGNVIKVEKNICVIPGMRYLDLEHEMGHFHQLTERFGKEIPPTEVVTSKGKKASAPPNYIKVERNAFLEYENRIEEVIRLSERNADSAVLEEHIQGLEEWEENYSRYARNNPGLKQWKEQYFPSFSDIEKRYRELIRDRQRTNRGIQS